MATLHGIPLYDGDLEQREGLPMAVQALEETAIASDGVLRTLGVRWASPAGTIATS